MSVGSGGDTSLASLGDDFATTEVNCSVCREPRAALKAMWCHRCGYYVCETCIDAARQCPKCLEGNIDQYSGGGGESGGGDDDALSLRSLGFRYALKCMCKLRLEKKSCVHVQSYRQSEEKCARRKDRGTERRT